MSETVLEVEGLHTYIGQHHILQGVTLTARRDAVTVLMGRNGAGKTTTMRSIIGLLHPARGAIRFEGQAIEGMAPYHVARLGVGFVPEGQGIFATLSVDENLRVAMHRDDAERRDRLARMLTLFPDLDRFRHARAGTLSGGQKQMLAIARAFVNPQRLLLIDLIAALRAVKHETTVLLVEQNFAMAEVLADHFFLIDDGRTVGEGPMSALVSDAGLKKRYLGI